MGKTEEKFLVLLNLLNNCRDKLYSLYNLFYANLKKAKGDSAEMAKLYDDVMSCHDELKVIDLQKDKKSPKLIVKNIVTRLNNNKQEFLEFYSQFKNALKDCMPLREEYKKEVVMCCDTYKKMKKGDEMDSFEKGYRQQVKLIKAILDKIKTCIIEYKNEDTVVENRKSLFDTTYVKSDYIAKTLV